MKKLLVGLFILICIVAVGYNAYRSEESAATGKQKVYALLPLSGGIASVGEQIKKTIDFAMQKDEYPFEIIYVDSESNPMKGLTALQAATISQDKPIVLGAMSSVGSVVAPYIDKKGGFLFGIVSQSINADVNSYQKITCSIKDILRPQIDRILKTYKKLDIVYVVDEFGLAEKNHLVAELKKNNFNNINELAVPLNVSDPKNEVVKLLLTKPEAVIILGNPTLGYINLFKELHLQGYKGDLLADEVLMHPFVQNSVQSYANGTITLANMPDIETDLTKEQKDLKESFEREGLRAYVVLIQVIDALNLIKYTIENDLPFERKTYEDLRDWKNVAGDVVSFKDGESTYTPLLVKYFDGKFYLLEGEK